jgi:CheY-like chemotaxis protein
MGHVVEEAVNGEQALERCYIRMPDLVMLDLVMPGMNGSEVLVKIRELNSRVPVIIVSSDIQTATAEEVRRNGAVALLNKPVARPLLEKTVTTALTGGTAWN